VDVTCGPGMIFGADPMFADTALGDFRLLPCSPARNAGSNAIVDSLGLLYDIAGSPRIQEGTVDMGAYESPAYEVAITGVVQPACQGGTGSFTATVTGGCAPFTVQFVGASSTEDSSTFVVPGLPSGSFTFIVTDSEARTDTIQVDIPSAPPINLVLSATPVDCAAGMPGSAIATASGGTGSLSLTWENGMQTPVLAGLSAGTYTATVTDSLGCWVTDSITVAPEGQLSVIVEATDVSCFGFSDGMVAATASGIPPYSWEWQGGQTDSLLMGSGEGSYSTTVTDALGCTGQAMAAVASPDSLSVLITGSDTLCFGSMEGELTAMVSGGTAPYSFDWQNGETDSLLSGIGAGNYMLTAEDANGCTVTAIYQVAESDLLTVSDTITHATNPTSSDGQIIITGVFGGTPGYSFLWNTGDTTQSLLNVPAGNYSLTLTDAMGCETVFSFAVDFTNATGDSQAAKLKAAIVPNPSGLGGAQLWLDTPKAEQFQLRVFDGLGRILFTQDLKATAGQNSFGLPTGLSPGIYWVRAENGQGTMTVLKWVVM